MKFISILGLSLILFSCNKKFTKQNLSIVEGITLGQPMDSLQEFYNKAHIPLEVYFTKSEFTDVSQLKYNVLKLYNTKIFDLSTYRNNSIDLSHIGILYPIRLKGTDNLIQMQVLLAHTTEPSFFNGKRVNSIIGDRNCIEQECNELIINDIIDIYTSKYGTPKVRYKTKNIAVYVIEGNNIKKYEETEEEGELISWENEAMYIDFFTGCPSYRSSFLTNPAQYQWHYSVGGPSKLPEIDYSKGQCKSYTCPYISYRLKNEAIESLELDKKKI